MGNPFDDFPTIAEQYPNHDKPRLDLCEREIQLIRQWFDSVQDCNPEYLERADYILARRIYDALSMRLPHSILDKC